MKHVMPVKAAVEVNPKAPTRRVLAKQQTRAKVLGAARRLFSQAGYEGATIREIAAAAGMSTGAVFANFDDKAHLFREIMAADMAQVSKIMATAGAAERLVEDSLLSMFIAGYGFYQSRLALARAAFSIAWTPDGGDLRLGATSGQFVGGMVLERLEAAIAQGELKADPQLQLRADMLFDAYLSNYPHAIFHGWTLEALGARSREQILILLSGVRPD